MMFQSIIAQSSISEYSVFEEFVGKTDVYHSGRYGRITEPKCLYTTDATYLTATKNNPNRDPILIRFKQNEIVAVDVGTITLFDPLYHQHPTVLLINELFYIFMNNAHGAGIKIWRSNTSDITEGFSPFHEISGSFGYCNPKLMPDGRVYIISRYTNSSASIIYDQVLLRSEPNNYTTWSTFRTTAGDYSTNGYRHYPSSINHYGNNTYEYIGISLRNDNDPSKVYFAQAVIKTLPDNFKEFSNLAGDFTKNVLTAPITTSELEDHCIILGSITSDTTYVSGMSCLVYNDVLYGSGVVSGAWKFFKNNAGVTTFYDCNLPHLPLTNNFGYHIDIHFNGNNFAIFSKGKTYASDLDFSNVTEVFEYYVYGDNTGINLVQPPENFDEIEGEYFLSGSDLEVGVVPYYRTNNTFQN